MLCPSVSITPRAKNKRANRDRRAACILSKQDTVPSTPSAAFQVNRAELNAVVLLTDILERLKPTLQQADHFYLWSDSAVTLTWAYSKRNTFRTMGIDFVGPFVPFGSTDRTKVLPHYGGI